MSENRNTQNVLFFCFTCKHQWEEDVPYVGFKCPKEIENRVCVKCGSKELRITFRGITMYPRNGIGVAEILREAGMDEPMERTGIGETDEIVREYDRILSEGKIAIADVERLDIEPGEFLVVKVPKDTPPGVVAHAASSFSRLLKGVKVMIVPKDWEMKIISEPPPLEYREVTDGDIQSATERAMATFQKHVAKG